MKIPSPWSESFYYGADTHSRYVDEIQHYGVLGMRWGVRKERRQQEKFRKRRDKVTNKAIKTVAKSGITDDEQKNIKAIHKKGWKQYADYYTKMYDTKRLAQLDSPKLTERQREAAINKYQKDVDAAYKKFERSQAEYMRERSIIVGKYGEKVADALPTVWEAKEKDE